MDTKVQKTDGEFLSSIFDAPKSKVPSYLEYPRDKSTLVFLLSLSRRMEEKKTKSRSKPQVPERQVVPFKNPSVIG